MMRPAPAGKVLLRKVNEILTACVDWIAWSDCDQPVSLRRVKIAAAGEGRASRCPAARSARRTYGPSLMNTLASPRPGQSAASCSAFGSAVIYSAASRSVINLRPSGSTIGSKNRLNTPFRAGRSLPERRFDRQI